MKNLPGSKGPNITFPRNDCFTISEFLSFIFHSLVGPKEDKDIRDTPLWEGKV